jgi:AraC-like DNA-binding protein
LPDKAGATAAEIARSVGYANRAHFNKIFKEEYGYFPQTVQKPGRPVGNACRARPGKKPTRLIAPDHFNNWRNPIAISAHTGFSRNKC